MFRPDPDFAVDPLMIPAYQREAADVKAGQIAAAGDLYDALKNLLDELGNSDFTTPYGSPIMHAVLKANAALTKAKLGGAR